MRQVLVALSSYVKGRLDSDPESVQQRDHAITNALEVVFRSREHIKVKPALQAVGEFLARSVITLPHLLEHFTSLSLEKDAPGDSSCTNGAMSTFLLGIFSWVNHSDVALASGQLSLQVLKQYLMNNAHIGSSPKSRRAPIWASPVITSVERNPECLRNFRNAIFPRIFRLSTHDFFDFLRSMRAFKHIPAYSLPHDSEVVLPDDASVSDIDIELLFCALQTGKELGIVKETGKIAWKHSEPFSTDSSQTSLRPFICAMIQFTFRHILSINS